MPRAVNYDIMKFFYTASPALQHVAYSRFTDVGGIKSANLCKVSFYMSTFSKCFFYGSSCQNILHSVLLCEVLIGVVLVDSGSRPHDFSNDNMKFSIFGNFK